MTKEKQKNICLVRLISEKLESTYNKKESNSSFNAASGKRNSAANLFAFISSFSFLLKEQTIESCEFSIKLYE